MVECQPTCHANVEVMLLSDIILFIDYAIFYETVFDFLGVPLSIPGILQDSNFFPQKDMSSSITSHQITILFC
jgi:hypothetical protein